MNNIYFIKIKNTDEEWAELYSEFKKAKKRYDALIKNNKFVFMQVINKDNNFNNIYDDWKKEDKNYRVYKGKKPNS